MEVRTPGSHLLEVSNQEDTLEQTQNSPEELHIPSGQVLTLNPQRGAGKCLGRDVWAELLSLLT